MSNWNRDVVSASSSSSSLYSSANRPQQHGLAFHDGIVRQTPPSWRQTYVTPRRQPSPLILDPSAPSSVVSESSDTLRLGGAATVRKLLEAATTRRREDHRPEEPDRGGTTAASFARTAPQAGFLSKLGTNIPEFKRRFFVLKPSTHLYYFLSPADTEPRGCIDMDDVQVREIQHLPDGRFRFAVQLQDERQIVLEARSQDVGQQWMASIDVERLSHVKMEAQKLQGINAQYKARIEELESKLEEYKLVERDRDGALEDASNWKSQFERLNEGLRLLTHHLRRAPEDEKKKEFHNAEQPVATDSDDNGQSADDTCLSTPQTTASPRSTSLLDDIAEEDQHIDDLEFPGTNFSTLLNACQQLRESLRLASVEASSAVEDLNAANEKMFATEKRMAKAEKHICKLWEENCAMRKTLKQSKTEKRVLVKEVKSLMAVVNETSQKLKHASLPQDRPAAPVRDDEERNVSPSEEERLIDELEEHVMTSIRLHEQFLGVNNGLADQLLASVQQIETGSYSENDDDPAYALGMHVTRTTDSPTILTILRSEHLLPQAAMHSNTSRSSDTGESAKLSPIKPTLLSLFDDQSDDDNSVDDEEKSSAPSFVSSVGAELGDVYDDLSEGTSIKTEAKEGSDTHSNDGRLQGEPQIPLRVGLAAFTPLAEDDNADASVASDEEERKHPMLRLDEEVDEEASAPNLCGSSTQSESTQSIITDSGNATSRLICPLADVIGTRRRDDKHVNPDFLQDGKVYHLTFYSRKIGIQFQKVKAETTSRGLLTEAMTADLPLIDGKSDGFTAAELRRIAAISNLATSTLSAPKTDEFCQVATPLDAVLVCGFHGFDDQANHVRPNLGARLVAFDGISVEVGKWTFDSVRKAIQARGRPLTLSFRNDFLTTKQRAILTKAVADIEKAIPLPRRTIQYKQRPPSAEPESNMSTQSHETEQFVNDAHPCADDDDMSVSVASSTRHSTFGRSSSASHSVGSYQGYRSFSDAGSSSVFSSTVGPLVGNLITNLKKNEPSLGIPNYLRSDAASLKNAPYHQDFTSSLL